MVRFRTRRRKVPVMLAAGALCVLGVLLVPGLLPREEPEPNGAVAPAGRTQRPTARKARRPAPRFTPGAPGDDFRVDEVKWVPAGLLLEGTCSPRGAVRIRAGKQTAILEPGGDRWWAVVTDVGESVEVVAEGIDGKTARRRVAVPSSSGGP
ncbi:MAG: hypothetical protein ACE5JG_12490, partial [Planctomycetota bacterium]